METAAQTNAGQNSDSHVKGVILPGMTLVTKPVETEGTFISKLVTMGILEQEMDVITLHVMFHEDLVVNMIISNQEDT